MATDIEAQAASLLAAYGTISDDKFQKHLIQLKADIKHRQVPERAINPIFAIIKLSIEDTYLADNGLSVLGHLTKRLALQDQASQLVAQTRRIYSSIVQNLGNEKDRVCSRAAQVLGELREIAPSDVERAMRDFAFTSENPKAKINSMHWIADVCSMTLLIRSMLIGIDKWSRALHVPQCPTKAYCLHRQQE